MSLDVWLRERRPVWQRLEAIVDGLYGRGPRRIPPQDLREMTELYQAACADLARLRGESGDPAIVGPLNRLVTRAHGQIYRGGPRRSWRVGDFFFVQYPRLVRREWRFILASFLLSALSAVMAFATVQKSPEVVADIRQALWMKFVFLVALGIDYNIFLMSRVREEAHKQGTRRATLVASLHDVPMAERGEWPVDTALYLEYKGANGSKDNDEWEGKLILSKDLRRWNRFSFDNPQFAAAVPCS